MHSNISFSFIGLLLVPFLHATATAEIFITTEVDGGQPVLNDNGKVIYTAGLEGDIFIYDSTSGAIQLVVDYTVEGSSTAIINNGGDIAWKRIEGASHQIFFIDRDDGSLQPIAVTAPSSFMLSAPHMNDAGNIVYHNQPPGETDLEVYLRIRATDSNPARTIRLTSNDQYDGAALIGGNNDVVWTHNDGDDEVYLYKFSTGETFILTNNSYQDNYVDAVNARGDAVWYGRLPIPGGSETDEEVFYYDNASNTVYQIVNPSCDDMYPDLNDLGDIVWNISCPGISGREIFMVNIGSPAPVNLTDNTYDEYLPKINNAKDVIWKAQYPGDDFTYELYAYNFSTGQLDRVTRNDESEWDININGLSQVVWRNTKNYVATPADAELMLKSLIWTLQMLSGTPPTQPISSANDIDADGRVGVAEALFFLKKSAEEGM